MCVQLFHDHPLWHEGYLSQRKSQIVSNAHLTRAALRVGVEPFVLTEPMTARRWTAPVRSVAPCPSLGKREVPSKVLADVLEALVGAAYVDGGMPLAWSMIHVFLTKIGDQMPPIGSGRPPKHGSITAPDLEKKVDQLIGYQFVERSIIWSAFTHPSWQRDLSTGSYQKLEFLGDAILDMIVANILHVHVSNLADGEMTKIKAAVVMHIFLHFYDRLLGTKRREPVLMAACQRTRLL